MAHKKGHLWRYRAREIFKQLVVMNRTSMVLLNIVNESPEPSTVSIIHLDL